MTVNQVMKHKEIREQVNRICHHAEMRSKKRLCRFLRYIIDETLAGRAEEIKGYTIALQVFERDTNFDPENDPIVRIEAGRLRRSLEMYYLTDGKNDPVQIVIPKGGYVPKFLPGGEIQSLSNRKKPTKPSDDRHLSFKPSIAVLPFKNLTGDPTKEYFVQGFTEELSIELTRFEDLVVLGCRLTPQSKELVMNTQDLAENLGAHFLLEGSVQLVDQQVIILIKLVDGVTNEHVWAERYCQGLSANNLIQVQEQISRKTARSLGSEYGIILQRLSKETQRRKPKEMDTYDAILRFYYFESHQTPESAAAAFKALEQAIQKDPESGVATAMLASLYGNMHTLDLPGNSGALEKMVELSEKALKLDPNSQMIRIVYAYKCFCCDEKEDFLKAVDQCLALNLNSPLRKGALGFHLSLFGEWERGKVLLDEVMNYPIAYPLFFYGATTLYYYRIKDYEKALKEAKNYNIPALFWGPMLRAAVLGQLARKKDARDEIKQLKSLRPDFEYKAEFLISRYVKEDKLVDEIMEGLRKAGLKI